MSDAVATITLITALMAGLSAGALLAFSTFAMKGLDDLEPAEGIKAMNAINDEAPKSGVFMLVLFGTVLACIALAVIALLDFDEDWAKYLLIGSLLYIVLPAGLTAVWHQPHNLALAKLDPHAPESAAKWAEYVRDWTRLNHLRVLGGGATLVLFAIALRVG
jgi:uncharacterized membrane protein